MSMQLLEMGGEAPTIVASAKRAVLKFAPKVFAVDVLPPSKHGSAYSYGLRIFPTTHDQPDTQSNGSDRSWNSDYEVWRRWEDCLDFQETLEEEYTLMAKEKRRRLKSGKGVKKGGVYIKSDFAASWDSLPAGPDYQDIATDIHAYLPKLSRKGGVFRASQTVVTQRGKEFKALIDALWMEDPPTLIKELRETSKIRDFFGFWRRDQERIRKLGIPGPVLTSELYGTASVESRIGSGHGSLSRTSFFPSFFMKPRSDDTESINSAAGTGFPESVRAPSMDLTIVPVPPPRHDSSGDDASGPSTPRSSPPTEAPLRFILDSSDNLVDSPVKATPRDYHRPPKLQFINGAGSPILSPIRESPGFSPHRTGHHLAVPVQPQSGRQRSGSFPSARENRNCRIVPGEPNSAGVSDVQYVYANSFVPSDDPATPSPRSPYGHRTSSHASSLSQYSLATAPSSPSEYAPTIFSIEESAPSSRPSSYSSSGANQPKLEERRVKGSAPVPEEVSRYSRGVDEFGGIYPSRRRDSSLPYRATQSVISLDTIGSDFLNEPLPPLPSSSNRFSAVSNQTLPEEVDEILDTFFANMSFPDVPNRQSSAGRESILYPIPQSDQFPAPFQHRPPGQFHLPWSPTRPQLSPDYTKVHSLAPPRTPPASTLSPVISIKAMYGEAIVVLKIERTCNLAQIRQKIYEKFSKQETVLISECFILGYIKPQQLIPSNGRQRTLSTSTVASVKSINSVDSKQLSFIVLEPEWKSVLKTCGPKLTLILLDP